MTPAILASLITLLLVGGPAFLWILHLHSARARLDDLLDASALREGEQRRRAVTAERSLAELRRRAAHAWSRVDEPASWDPNATPAEGRPASPPPESRSRA